MPRPTTAAATLAGLALITGCAATPVYQAPEPPPAPAPPTTEPAPGVPVVEHPLDITAVLDDPCRSLTTAQVAEYLGADAETDLDTAVSSGPYCSWHSDMYSDAHISVGYPRLTDEGLTAIYRHQRTAEFFIELVADGYPAVAVGLIDDRDDGECLVIVGTSDSDYVTVRVYLGDSSVGKIDPCEAAHEVATAVISNIKGQDVRSSGPAEDRPPR